MKVKETFTKLLEIADKKSPAILTGLAISGTIFLAGMVIKPKAKKIMDRHREEMNGLDLNKDEMSEEEYKEAKHDICAGTVKEMVKETLPTVALTGAICACSIGAHKIAARRVAAVSAAYEIAARSLSDYKEKVEEIVPKKAQEIKEGVIKKRVHEEPLPAGDNGVYSTGRGDVLCKDIYTKVYFRSSMDEIEKAINRMSARVRNEGWITVSDLYYELGLKGSQIPPITSDIGWHDSNCIEGNLPIMVTTCLDESGTIPVIGLDYEVDPFFKEGGRFR